VSCGLFDLIKLRRREVGHGCVLVDEYDRGHTISPELKSISRSDSAPLDALTVDERPVQAFVVGEIKTVSARLNERVLLGGDTLNARVEPYTAVRATADRQKTTCQFERSTRERSVFDGQA